MRPHESIDHSNLILFIKYCIVVHLKKQKKAPFRYIKNTKIYGYNIEKCALPKQY